MRTKPALTTLTSYLKPVNNVFNIKLKAINIFGILFSSLLLLTSCPYESTEPIGTPAKIDNSLLGDWEQDNSSALNSVFGLKDFGNIWQITKSNEYEFDAELVKKTNDIDTKYKLYKKTIGDMAFIQVKQTERKFFLYRISQISENRIELQEINQVLSEYINGSGLEKYLLENPYQNYLVDKNGRFIYTDDYKKIPIYGDVISLNKIKISKYGIETVKKINEGDYVGGKEIAYHTPDGVQNGPSYKYDKKGVLRESRIYDASSNLMIDEKIFNEDGKPEQYCKKKKLIKLPLLDYSINTNNNYSGFYFPFDTVFSFADGKIEKIRIPIDTIKYITRLLRFTVNNWERKLKVEGEYKHRYYSEGNQNYNLSLEYYDYAYEESSNKKIIVAQNKWNDEGKFDGKQLERFWAISKDPKLTSYSIIENYKNGKIEGECSFYENNSNEPKYKAVVENNSLTGELIIKNYRPRDDNFGFIRQQVYDVESEGINLYVKCIQNNCEKYIYFLDQKSENYNLKLTDTLAIVEGNKVTRFYDVDFGDDVNQNNAPLYSNKSSYLWLFCNYQTDHLSQKSLEVFKYKGIRTSVSYIYPTNQLPKYHVNDMFGSIDDDPTKDIYDVSVTRFFKSSDVHFGIGMDKALQYLSKRSVKDELFNFVKYFEDICDKDTFADFTKKISARSKSDINHPDQKKIKKTYGL